MANAAFRRPLGVLVLVLILAASSGLSLAQESATEEGTESGELAAAEEAEPAVVDTIIVTASKREENIQEVPVSVTAINTEDVELLTMGAMDVRFLSNRVPSLHIESSFGRAFPRFYIRGLGNTDFDLNASQPVSLVYDEIVLENPVVKGMPVWDLDRIEVLRGPQGTLFGRNTPAGIVKFESKKPSQERDAYLRTSLGTYNTLDVKTAFGGRITDTLSGRISLLYQSREDWIDNEFTGQEDALGGYKTGGWRFQLLWEPNEKFSGLFNWHGWNVDGTARVFRANILQQGSNNLVPGFSQDKIAHDGLNQQDIDSMGGMIKLDYDLGNATLTSVTGYESLEMYSRGDIDGGFGAVFAPPFGPGFIPFPSESADGLPDLTQVTQEFRVTNNLDGGNLNWLAGLFFFNEELQADTFSYNTLGGNAQDGYSFQKQDSTSWALFGSLEYLLGEDWSLRAGLRYSADDRDYSAERPDPTFQTPTLVPITRKTDSDFLAWDLSATYTVNPDVNVYGRVATSYRAPSIQGRILFCADFEFGLNPATNCVSVADQEEILSAEVGVKSELASNRVRLNLTGYTYQVDGQQIVAVGGQFNTATLLNADKTDGYGFESDIQVAPNPDWLMTFGVSYNKTEIKDDTLAVAPCGGGCTVLDPIGPNGALVDGNSLPHAPEWIFNGIVDYRKPVGAGLVLASLDWAYYSEKRFFLYESEEFRADGIEWGLRVGYTFSEAKYELALFGRNITDEKIVRNGIDFNNLTGMTNDPRTWGLEFVVNFR